MLRILTAIAAGAAAMFLLDPADGARRRNALRNRFASAGETARGRVERVVYRNVPIEAPIAPVRARRRRVAARGDAGAAALGGDGLSS